MEISRAKDLLANLGYLPHTAKSDDAALIASAVKKFQRNYGLERRDGELSIETVRALRAPRCGFPDGSGSAISYFSRRLLVFNTHVVTTVYRYSDGDLAGVAECPWKLQDRPFTLRYDHPSSTPPEFVVAVEHAMRRWEKVKRSGKSVVLFEKASTGVSPDFYFRWIGAKVPGYNLQQNAVARACLPCECSAPLSVDFDGDESWSIGVDNTAFNVEAIAIHEIGHVLGLVHPDPLDGSTMDPRFSEGAPPDDVHPKTQDKFLNLYK